MNNEIKTEKLDDKNKLSVLLGSAFLMATAAIGPGFLVQTTTFTEQLGATFGFVILTSMLISLVAQLNIWRILAVANMRGQDIANKVLPGLGNFLGILIALGGLAFTIANVGGGAMGLNALFGIDMKYGSIIFPILAIIVFMFKQAEKAIDTLTKVLGGIMIVIVGYIAISSNPPVGEAIYRTFIPEEIPFLAIITLVGGTVGGFISFSGGHRFLDAGIHGEDSLDEINRSANMGMIVVAIMRVLLFLAILGVVSKGHALDPANPTADAFRIAAGNIGYRFFGAVIFAAALSSVVGCSYTSISFLTSISDVFAKHESRWCMVFLAISGIVYALIGEPANLLVIAGAVNGLILPLILGIMLIATKRKDIVGDYEHSTFLFITGMLVVLVTLFLGLKSFSGLKALF